MTSHPLDVDAATGAASLRATRATMAMGEATRASPPIRK